MKKNRILPTSLALGAGIALALAVPMSASAHVGASADTTAAGAYAVITLSVPHGIDGAPTQSVAIEIPDSIISVTPTVNPNWVISETTVPLDPPAEDQTERVSVVTYTAKDAPLDAHQRDTFQISVQLPAGEAGDVVEFRTTQTSPEGATMVWEGDEVPSITLTAAAEGGEDGHDHGAEETAMEEIVPISAGGDDLLARGLGIAGLVLGAIGLVLGVTALRRKTAE